VTAKPGPESSSVLRTKSGSETLHLSIYCNSKIQCCGTALVTMQIRIQNLDDQKLLNFTPEKIYSFFLSKITIYLSLGLHEAPPSYRRSHQSSKENIQLLKP
jgi:hypothetical protein